MRSRRQHGRSAFLTRAAWLGRQDSNLGMAESKSAALPLGYAPTRGRTILARMALIKCPPQVDAQSRGAAPNSLSSIGRSAPPSHFSENDSWKTGVKRILTKRTQRK